jgi:phenol 2-monooxygenase
MTSNQAKHSYVDVLIVGAGPAGHMAATWFARTGVKARIIDKRSEKQFAGQADGLQSRTLEVFQSFGFGDRAIKESNHMLDLCFWEPNANGDIHRSHRMPDSTIGISRFQQTVLHQGRVEAWFRDSWKKWSDDNIKLERPVQASELHIDESIPASNTTEYPVSVTVQHLPEEVGIVEQYGSKIANGLFRAFDGDGNARHQGEEEVIHAKYVLGCDGAHSWVRRQLGISMEGESTDYIWGVLDGVPITDFPDIRCRCAIHSAGHGSIMIIPREHGMVRLYIQLRQTAREESPNGESTGKSQRIDRSKITPELILENAAKIFAPYKIDMVNIKWYTAYQIGQRVATDFHKNNRVFICGDACHTHSPKAGQGMNVSMMDTYNLAWKMVHVVKGLASPSILETYEPERKTVAENLIAYDYKLSRLFSGRPAVPGAQDSGVDLAEFHRVFEMGNGFASGTTVDYKGSVLVDKPQDAKAAVSLFDEELFHSEMAKNCPIGRRFDTAQVVTVSDAKPIELADAMPSDGRWRVAYFAGNIKENEGLHQFMETFGSYLAGKNNFVKKYTPASAKLYSVVDVLLIHASQRTAIEWNDFPEAFRPRDHLGRMDYWRIFADDESYHQGHGHAYAKYGINPSFGALVVIRPDGYVSSVQPLSDAGIKNIEEFFQGFMNKQNPSLANSQPVVDPPKEEKEWYGVADYGSPVLAV